MKGEGATQRGRDKSERRMESSKARESREDEQTVKRSGGVKSSAVRKATNEERVGKKEREKK